eukprot:TRINITY_DN2727_c0_g1_i1.p1 TRINITY_DN2727_c0_g1~~TRINITY_DN2727_c0_g1_i1.p1  ORF type:complete len:787 (-),score=263.03 TRINITY_DN2727_c0_g1_i1:44-2404(-)
MMRSASMGALVVFTLSSYMLAVDAQPPKPSGKKPPSMKAALEKASAALKACSGSKEECRNQMKEKAKETFGKTMSKEAVAEFLRKMGASEASEEIKKCLASASDMAAKKACKQGDAAREKMAQALGKDKSQVTDADLRKGFKDQTKQDVLEGVKQCMQSAADAKAKKACFKSDDIKDKIAGAEDKGKAAIKDSDVRQYLMKGARESALTTLENCGEADKETCKQQAKEELAQALGKNVSDIKERVLEMDAKKAMVRGLVDKVRTCIEEAGSDKVAAAKCRKDMVKSTLQSATFHGTGTPSDTEVAMALKEAAKATAVDIKENCELSAAECMKLLKTELATLFGKNVSDMDVKRMHADGAKEAAKSAALACARAKKDDANATCDDPIEMFKSFGTKMMPANAKAKGVDKSRMKESIAKSVKKDALKACLYATTKAEADTCLADLKEEAEDITSELYRDLSPRQKEAKEKRSKNEAKVEAVGERFHACLEEASTDEAKKACKTDLTEKAKVAGLRDDPEKVALKFRGKLVSEAIGACEKSERAACLKKAKEDLVKTGVKERAFGQIKKLAAVKEAAEVWAACKENETNSDLDCDDVAKAVLEEQTGAVSEEFWTANAEKVKKLAKALVDGAETVLRKLKRVDVDAETDGSLCSNVTKASINTKLGSILSVEKVVERACFLLFSKASYGASLVPTAGKDDDASIEKISNDAAAELKNADLSSSRRLGARRLESVSSVYADQAVEECSSEDASCKDEEEQKTTISGSFAPSARGLVSTVLIAFFPYIALA